MAPHSSTLAWKIPWTEEPGGLQSMALRRVRHDWATSLSLFTFMHWRRKWQRTPVFLPGESQGQRSPGEMLESVTIYRRVKKGGWVWLSYSQQWNTVMKHKENIYKLSSVDTSWCTWKPLICLCLHDGATSLSLFTFMHGRRKWQPTPVFLPGKSHGQRSLGPTIPRVTKSPTRLKQFSRT